MEETVTDDRMRSGSWYAGNCWIYEALNGSLSLRIRDGIRPAHGEESYVAYGIHVAKRGKKLIGKSTSFETSRCILTA